MKAHIIIGFCFLILTIDAYACRTRMPIELDETQTKKQLSKLGVDAKRIRYYQFYRNRLHVDLYPQSESETFSFSSLDCWKKLDDWSCDQKELSGFNLPNDSYVYIDMSINKYPIDLYKLKRVLLDSYKSKANPRDEGSPILSFPSNFEISNQRDKIFVRYHRPGTCSGHRIVVEKVDCDKECKYILTENKDVHWA